MKKQINLIPSEMMVPARLIKFSSLLNKISIIGVLVLITSVLLLISSIVYYNVSYKQSTANVEVLKNNILDLEKNEQKLVLTKDKLSKIAYIRSLKSVDNEIASFQNFQNLTSGSTGANFSDISIDSKKTEVSIKFQNSNDFKNTFEIISNLAFYKEIILSSLGFNSKTGYLVSLILNNE